jgi:hypothetical protein
MENEDNLINQRSTLHLVIQGFLFATFGVIGELPAATGTDRLYLERWFLVYVLASADAAIAGFAYKSIKAANNAIKSLCEKWPAILEPYEKKTKNHFPAITGGGHPTAMDRGKSPAMWIPSIVAGAWILIFSISIYDRFILIRMTLRRRPNGPAGFPMHHRLQHHRQSLQFCQSPPVPIEATPVVISAYRKQRSLQHFGHRLL